MEDQRVKVSQYSWQYIVYTSIIVGANQPRLNIIYIFTSLSDSSIGRASDQICSAEVAGLILGPLILDIESNAYLSLSADSKVV